MRVMISLPMYGHRTKEVIERINELKEKFSILHIDVIDSFLNESCPDEIYRPGVYYLGKTLTKFLSNVDAVYFDKGWEEARGCRIERKICEEYGILILDDNNLKFGKED